LRQPAGGSEAARIRGAVQLDIEPLRRAVGADADEVGREVSHQEGIIAPSASLPDRRGASESDSILD